MYGMSYVGATQWLAAISSPPHLECIFPVMTAADYWDGWIYQGGAMYLSFAAAWAVQFLAIPQLERLGLSADERKAEEAKIMESLGRLRRTLSHVPLSELPWFEREGLAPYYREWMEHPSFDEYWQRVSIAGNHSKVTVPAFAMGGWYDLFLAGPLRNFEGLRKGAANEAARNGQKLLVGPWTHNSPSIAQVGERNFGLDATLVLEDLQLRWFERWLKQVDNGIDREPPVRLYVMNQGWRDEEEFPIARTQYTPLYIESNGRANGLDGDGRLSFRKPERAQTADVFLSNPASPTPTIGAAGIVDQRPVERRLDVLVYSTPPLTEPVEVTGPVSMVLYASTSAPDTDFTAKLVDVAPDGYATNLCDGIVRASYRDSKTEPTPLTPDRVYEFHIDMLYTANLFQAGHRIRVEVASGNFPRYSRNPNTGQQAECATEMRPALQTVYHDPARPSHLILPVIPR
jgi:putative CocE/NonD family hydrolase